MTAREQDATREVSPSDEAYIFRRMRRRYLQAVLQHAFRESTVRTALLVSLTAILWGGVYMMFYEAFELLHVALSDRALQARTVQTAFNLFFFSLTLMMALSAAVIYYAAVFRSPEVRYLLTTPTRPSRISLDKFYETLFLSCWGFLLLGSPMLIAYGNIVAAPWYYFCMILPFVIAFVCLPSGVGASVCLLVVYAVPRLRWYLLSAVAVVALLGGLWLVGQFLVGQPHDQFSTVWFQQMLTRLEFAQQPWLPSWWLSMGLLELAHPAMNVASGQGSWREGLGYLNALLANALLIPYFVQIIGGYTLRPAYTRIYTMGHRQIPIGFEFLDRGALLLIAPFPRSMRVLLLKDLRTFRRDPLHWSQFLIFAGLLAMYFVTIPRFDYGPSFRTWMAMVGFLNLAAIGLILSTFTTRFIFPLISMEGQRFWILGTMPLQRDVILWSKFLFAMLVCLPPCAILTFLSDVMLGIVRHFPLLVLVHMFTCVVLCLGLAALSVGIGARLPNLRETSPARITAGFGGTLTLILSALYIVLIVTATAIPGYFYLRGLEGMEPSAGWTGWLSHPAALAVGMLVSGTAGLATTWIPLRSGMEAFRRLES